MKSEPKIFYGYIIVIAVFSIYFVMDGFLTTYGVFFKPLQDTFGWNRATISGASSLQHILGGLSAILGGRLIDKFGPRIVMSVCAVILSFGYYFMSEVNSIWQLYLLYGVIVAIGSSSGNIAGFSTTARWFVGRRGIMTGLGKVGTGAGFLVIPLVARWLISSYGWRNAYIVSGVMVLIGIAAAAQFLRRDPSQKGLKAYGAPQGKRGSVKLTEPGLSFQEAGRTRQFWTVCAIYFLIQYCVSTVLLHIAPHAQGLGFSPTRAASMISFIGGASIAGRLVMGNAGDRAGYRRALLVNFIIYTAALSWLLAAKALWMLYLFTTVYGFAHGGFFSLVSPLVAELFGTRSHGVIFSIVSFFGTVGSAIGATLGGLIFDVTASYQIAFVILVVLSVTGFTLSLSLKPMQIKK